MYAQYIQCCAYYMQRSHCLLYNYVCEHAVISIYQCVTYTITMVIYKITSLEHMYYVSVVYTVRMCIYVRLPPPHSVMHSESCQSPSSLPTTDGSSAGGDF